MDWEIDRATSHCVKCEKQFQEEQEYFSCLLDEQGRFVRRDFCPECWDGTAEAFSFWKTRVPPKDEPKKIFLDDSVLVDFFQRLQDEEAADRVQFRYIVALMLMRKKILKFQDIAHEGGQEFLVLKLRGDGTIHRVRDPQLSDEQLDDVKEQVTQLLAEP